MVDEPESLVLQQLGLMRAEIAESQAQLRSEMASLRADVASDLVTMQANNEAEHKATRKMTGEQIAGLRRAVVEYHSAVVGHGMLVSDLEAHVRRLEDKVGISDS